MDPDTARRVSSPLQDREVVRRPEHGVSLVSLMIWPVGCSSSSRTCSRAGPLNLGRYPVPPNPVHASNQLKRRTSLTLRSCRGIGNLVRTIALSRDPSEPLHFYCSSGGNAGLACASATALLSLPCTVVVPTSTKPHMVRKLREAGSCDEIVSVGATWSEADTFLRTQLLGRGDGGVYVPPFDHPAIWDGAATIVSEVEEDLGGPADAVVCAVGGGGLFCGIMQGLAAAGRESSPSSSSSSSGTRVVAVETRGADSFAQAMEKGELVTLPGITSVATSLGATRVCARALRYGLDERERVRSVVVSDEQACGACVRFADGERMMVEPACGAALAVVYGEMLAGLGLGLREESNVVCGGVGVSLEMLAEWRGMV